MKRPYVLTAVALAAMVVLDLLLGRDIPGFFAAYGLASCIVIVLASKWMGKHALQRDEGYYDDAVEG